MRIASVLCVTVLCGAYAVPAAASAPFDAGEAAIQAQQAAFEKFLRTRYSITTTDLHPQCVAVGDETQALAAIKQWTSNGNARGRTIDTAWKMGG
jgi:hypothetical protein